MNRLVLIGAGGHARVVAEAVAGDPTFEIAGFVDDRRTEALDGWPILGATKDLERIMDSGVAWAFCCIGDNTTRKRVTEERLLATGFKLATIVHKRAHVAHNAVIGEGTLVAAGAVVAPGASIGRGCIINHCASVDHDSKLGGFVHVAPGAHLCGAVSVGNGTLVGVGASLAPGVHVGSFVKVGAGAVVIREVPDGSTVVGVPAKNIEK